MRLTEFMIVIVAALMFLIPTMKKESDQIQMQEEEVIEEQVVEDGEEINTFKIRFEVADPSDEAVADIIWIKKAAEVAKDAGIPYFNVKKQTITKRFVKEFNQKLSVIEGVIELDNDPMEAEYDAHEIESLVLSDVE